MPLTRNCSFWLALAFVLVAVTHVGHAEGDLETRYYYVQLGPTFGIVDDSFKGDYEDTIGLNGRVGARFDRAAFELHVEGLNSQR